MLDQYPLRILVAESNLSFIQSERFSRFWARKPTFDDYIPWEWIHIANKRRSTQTDTYY